MPKNSQAAQKGPAARRHPRAARSPRVRPRAPYLRRWAFFSSQTAVGCLTLPRRRSSIAAGATTHVRQIDAWPDECSACSRRMYGPPGACDGRRSVGGAGLRPPGISVPGTHEPRRRLGDGLASLGGDGHGQQRIYVLPALRLAVTILAGRYNDRRAARLADRLLLEHIIPATMPESIGATPKPSNCDRPTAAPSRPATTFARSGG